MAVINFFDQDAHYKLPNPRKTTAWIRGVVKHEKKQLANLNYIFCSDAYLLGINQQYLKHKTLTDIITFDNSEESGMIEGDIFISIERVADNAALLNKDPDEELHRVLIHGVLHLAGYGDKTDEEKREMRKKEDAYLSLRNH